MLNPSPDNFSIGALVIFIYLSLTIIIGKIGLTIKKDEDRDIANSLFEGFSIEIHLVIAIFIIGVVYLEVSALGQCSSQGIHTLIPRG